MKNITLFVLMGCVASLASPHADAASRTRIDSQVRSSVSSSGNSDIVVGEDVVIDGPIERGVNSSSTWVDTGVDSGVHVGNGVSISNGNVNVGNGAVRVGNNTSSKRWYGKGSQIKRTNRYITRRDASNMGQERYRSGNCTVERKWVGSMVKENMICP